MKVNLSARLVASHLCLGVFALLFITGIFWKIASNALRNVGQQGAAAVEHADYDRLNTMCRIKEKQLNAWTKAMEGHLRMVSDTPWAVEAARAFSSAFSAGGNSTSVDAWQEAAKKYDMLFRNVCVSLGWQDVFLISTTGNIIYSMNKGTELGFSLRREPLRSSSLGRALAALQKNADIEMAFGDFLPYAALNNTPAAFLVTRMKEQEQVVAYMAFQISSEAIKDIMAPTSTKDEKLESYLVGMDGYMRSDSLLDPERYSRDASFKQDNKVQTQAVQNALAGKDGTGIITDYRSRKVLSSWLAVAVFTTRWALICEIDESEAMQSKASMRSTTSEASLHMLLCGGLALLFTLLLMTIIASYIARSINMPIMKAAQAANAVASGDFTQRLNMRRSDEIGLMADALDHMAEKVSISLWHKTGVAELAEQMRGRMDMQTLAHRIAACMAKHLDAQMALLYLADEKGDHLTLTGTYAFHKRKGINSQINIGEGIAGQAALERNIISVTDLPADYIRISSGLGDAAPRNILAAPFVYEGKLMGVLEFAAFKEFSDAEIAFVKEVQESIAVVFASAKSRQIQELLEETQKQAEELRRHGEELRASNEKLAMQAEELQAMQAMLEASNTDLEEKSAVLTVQKQEIEKRNQELVRARKELEKRSQELALASKYKSEFLANMSHELRTPMNSLLLLAQSLQANSEGNLTANQRQAAEIIVDSGKDLLNIIDEILDLATIEAGRIRKQVGEVMLADLADNAQALFLHMAAAKGLSFNVSVEPDLPVSIVTDRTRLEQILKNFIGNSLKFTESGEISLTFAHPPADVQFRRGNLALAQTVAISVKDTGIGIPEDKQQIIFEAFQQADGSTARKYGGTGLGLSISKELAALLGGEINLRSEPGKGSVFTLYLPLRDESAASSDRPPTEDDSSSQSAVPLSCPPVVVRQPPPRAKSKSEKIILIIEDDQAFTKLLTNKCRQRGFKVLTAESGEEGLRLAELRQPIGIILDIQLPGMDGWAVLSSLKSNPATQAIPVQMMSALEGSQEAIRQGASGFFAKPVAHEQIAEALARIEAASDSQLKRLLVVEDDDALRAALVELVGGSGIAIEEARTGQEAHALLCSQHFDCMVLDLGLSDCNGIDLLRRLSDLEGLQLPPVIIHTGRELSREEEAELNQHAESIIIKNARSRERLLEETSLFLHRVVEQLPEQQEKDAVVDLNDQACLLKGKKILLADDDMRNVFALSGILEEKGMEVLVAEDGRKALNILAEDGAVDLVLMDIMMPDMDGYETTRMIRAQTRFADMPVIALTAKAMKEDRAKCLEAGASEYLAKPIDVERLLAMMLDLLCKRTA